MATKAKAVGPIITAVVEVALAPIHYIICALRTAAAAVITTAGAESEAAAEATGTAGVAMMYIGTWGGTVMILLGAACLLIGAILAFSNKNDGAGVCAKISKVAGIFLYLIALYLLVTCGFMTGKFIGFLACVPTFIAAFFMCKSAKTLRNVVA